MTLSLWPSHDPHHHHHHHDHDHDLHGIVVIVVIIITNLLFLHAKELRHASTSQDRALKCRASPIFAARCAAEKFDGQAMLFQPSPLLLGFKAPALRAHLC